jgi:hypothetical protein
LVLLHPVEVPMAILMSVLSRGGVLPGVIPGAGCFMEFLP